MAENALITCCHAPACCPCLPDYLVATFEGDGGCDITDSAVLSIQGSGHWRGELPCGGNSIEVEVWCDLFSTNWFMFSLWHFKDCQPIDGNYDEVLGPMDPDGCNPLNVAFPWTFDNAGPGENPGDPPAPYCECCPPAPISGSYRITEPGLCC